MNQPSSIPSLKFNQLMFIVKSLIFHLPPYITESVFNSDIAIVEMYKS